MSMNITNLNTFAKLVGMTGEAGFETSIEKTTGCLRLDGELISVSDGGKTDKEANLAIRKKLFDAFCDKAGVSDEFMQRVLTTLGIDRVGQKVTDQADRPLEMRDVKILLRDFARGDFKEGDLKFVESSPSLAADGISDGWTNVDVVTVHTPETRYAAAFGQLDLLAETVESMPDGEAKVGLGGLGFENGRIVKQCTSPNAANALRELLVRTLDVVLRGSGVSLDELDAFKEQLGSGNDDVRSVLHRLKGILFPDAKGVDGCGGFSVLGADRLGRAEEAFFRRHDVAGKDMKTRCAEGLLSPKEILQIDIDPTVFEHPVTFSSSHQAKQTKARFEEILGKALGKGKDFAEPDPDALAQVFKDYDRNFSYTLGGKRFDCGSVHKANTDEEKAAIHEKFEECFRSVFTDEDGRTDEKAVFIAGLFASQTLANGPFAEMKLAPDASSELHFIPQTKGCSSTSDVTIEKSTSTPSAYRISFVAKWDDIERLRKVEHEPTGSNSLYSSKLGPGSKMEFKFAFEFTTKPKTSIKIVQDPTTTFEIKKGEGDGPMKWFTPEELDVD